MPSLGVRSPWVYNVHTFLIRVSTLIICFLEVAKNQVSKKILQEIQTNLHFRVDLFFRDKKNFSKWGSRIRSSFKNLDETKIASYCPTKFFSLIKAKNFCFFVNARLDTFPRSGHPFHIRISFIEPLGNPCQIRIFCWDFVTEKLFLSLQNQQTKSTFKSQDNSPRFFCVKTSQKEKQTAT